jgi:hypothetical protein
MFVESFKAMGQSAEDAPKSERIILMTGQHDIGKYKGQANASRTSFCKCSLIHRI